ncbi:histidine phosphatase family protein [Streptomyces sp. NRRL WC-3742]|uniref:histidine phosphatase family protein n=1 Tax=Streptomyces sp. NRRL WC-3742 TaxID=1463934 RepID=UPI0004C856A5|nr:histidine phosphatase family protein [Streptomyces sp. NRRL WC-3742]
MIFLVRHGEADYDTLVPHAPVYEGARRDFAPLTACGLAQVQDAAQTLRGFQPTLVVSSPYTRTLQTGALLASALGCELRIDLSLHDWLPVRDGRTPVTADSVRRAIDEYELWRSSGHLPSNRQWETDAEMAERLKTVAERHQSPGPLVLVSHEAVIKAATGSKTVDLASIHPLRA